MSSSFLISVIITTYNREDALDVAVRALAAQTDRNFEIVIADDGSGPDTGRLVESWKPRLSIPLKHVRHEHRGFRGGEIRNRGIRASDGALCIFLDGDCLARPDFIASHRRLYEPGWFVIGNRILLSRELTAAILAQGLAPQTWTFGALARQRLSGGINRLLPAVHLPLGPLRKLQKTSWRGAQTCNFAVARSDLDHVESARLTGRKALGVGDASGMFPVDPATHDYDGSMLKRFGEMVAGRQPGLNVAALFPEVLVAGEDAGTLSAEGVALLDPTGRLKPGAPVCPPEGDAGTGMVATNAIAQRTGSISTGTSIRGRSRRSSTPPSSIGWPARPSGRSRR